MTLQEEDNLLMFLDGLTELSRRHNLGIAGQPILFVMQNADYDRSYSTDDESNLTFR